MKNREISAWILAVLFLLASLSNLWDSSQTKEKLSICNAELGIAKESIKYANEQIEDMINRLTSLKYGDETKRPFLNITYKDIE